LTSPVGPLLAASDAAGAEAEGAADGAAEAEAAGAAEALATDDAEGASDPTAPPGDVHAAAIARIVTRAKPKGRSGAGRWFMALGRSSGTVCSAASPVRGANRHPAAMPTRAAGACAHLVHGSARQREEIETSPK
jgi:hypothetical protein